MHSTDASRKRAIVPLDMGKDASWLDARNLVRKEGGLPSNRLHTEVLLSNAWIGLNETSRYYGGGAWAREILVYPEPGKTFRAGIDVVDPFKDHEGREWRFQAKYVPEEALDRKGIGLFVDPKKVIVKRYSVTIMPLSVVVLENFIQGNGYNTGRIDAATGVPLHVDEDEEIPVSVRGQLFRLSGLQGVRPILRCCLGCFSGLDILDRSAVYVDSRVDRKCGVAFVREVKERPTVFNGTDALTSSTTTDYLLRRSPVANLT
jgi:hypothetical protein